VAEEERAIALAEIEKARAAVEKVEKSLQMHDSMSSSREKEVHPCVIINSDFPLSGALCCCQLSYLFVFLSVFFVS
jgi:hypothetical protein